MNFSFKTLLSHTMNFGLGNVISKLVGFFLIPVYTVYLTTEDYGLIEICGSITTFLTVFMRLGLPGSVTRFFFDFEEGMQLRDYVTTVTFFLIGISLAIALIFLGFGYLAVEKMIPELSFYPFALWIAYEAAASCFINIQNRLIIARQQSRYSMILNIAMTIIGISLSLLFVVYYKMGIYGIILSAVIGTTLFMLQAVYYLWPDLKGKFNKELLKDSLRYGLGILPSHLMSNAVPLINRLFVVALVSMAALGLFGVAVRFASPLVLLTAAFSSAYKPIYYSIRNTGTVESTNNLKVLNEKIWFGALLLFTFSALYMPSILQWMTPESYHEGAFLIPILNIGFLGEVFYILYGQEVFFNKKTRWVPFITAASIIFNLLIVMTLTKTFGVAALAAGLSIGFVASAVVGTILTIKYLKGFHISFKFFVQSLILIVLVLIYTLKVKISFDTDLAYLLMGTGGALLTLGIISISNKPFGKLNLKTLRVRN